MGKLEKMLILELIISKLTMLYAIRSSYWLTYINYNLTLCTRKFYYYLISVQYINFKENAKGVQSYFFLNI